MNEREAMLAAILADPEADLPRLMYADWLEEYGSDPKRAELIRIQCDPLYSLPCEQVWNPGLQEFPHIEVRCLDYVIAEQDTEENWCPQCKVRHRVMQILHTYDTESVKHEPYPFTGNGWTAYTVCQYSRGLVCEVRCPMSGWLDHGPRLVREHPIQFVRITDREPFYYGPFDDPTPIGQRRCAWSCDTNMNSGWYEEGSTVLLSSSISDEIAAHMVGHYQLSFLFEFENKAKAEESFSRACLKWAKQQPNTQEKHS